MVGGSASALLHVVKNARERAAPGPRLPRDEQGSAPRVRLPVQPKNSDQSVRILLTTCPTHRRVRSRASGPMSFVVAYGLG